MTEKLRKKMNKKSGNICAIWIWYETSSSRLEIKKIDDHKHLYKYTNKKKWQ